MLSFNQNQIFVYVFVLFCISKWKYFHKGQFKFWQNKSVHRSLVLADIQILVWGWKVTSAAGSRTPGSGEEPVQSGTLEELLHKTTEYKTSVVFSHFYWITSMKASC